MAEKIADATLPGWTFIAEEISNGIWKIEAQHMDGRSVSRLGYDYDVGLEKCKEDARRLPNKAAWLKNSN